MKSKDSSFEVLSTLSHYVQDTSKRATDINEECTPTKKKSVKFIIEDPSDFDMTKAAPDVYLTHKGVLGMRKKTAEKDAMAEKSQTEDKRKQAVKKCENCGARREKKGSRQKLPKLQTQLTIPFQKSRMKVQLAAK